VHHPRHPYTQALIAAVPDPDPTTKLPDLPIKGYVPVTPEEILHSCNFFPHCPYGEKKCRESQPQLTRIDEDHLVSCFKVHDLG
jgi:oligopeptide/dipeptide ABC transporter ATP-binding protein